jgi:alpha-glucosidase
MPRAGAHADPRSAALPTLMMCLRGSVCLYQGEELGLPEADVAFDDLQDPYGIEFWPEFKGRDGCRTPMVWGNPIQSKYRLTTPSLQGLDRAQRHLSGRKTWPV